MNMSWEERFLGFTAVGADYVVIDEYRFVGPHSLAYQYMAFDMA